MADLYSNTNDGHVYSSTLAAWADARDDTTGHAVGTGNNSAAAFVAAYRFAARGGGNAYRVLRSFMYFDTSGISGTVSSATIKLYGFSSGTDGSIIAVKSTAFGGDGATALAVEDLDAITGYSTGASLAGNATDYSNTILAGSWNASGYNDLTGTEDLRADMQNNDVVIICFMDYTNDYLNSALTSNGTLNFGAYYTDQGGTNVDPYIEYEIATGYGNKVLGVTAGNIAKVDGVATANIEKVIGV